MSVTTGRIYLDNAATSWPKPETVYAAVNHYQRDVGVAAGRGNYQDAEDIARTIQQTRANISRLVRATAANHIIFTHNCTDSLNIVIQGLLREGDHVVTSVDEHNSILRPLAELRIRRNIQMTMVSVNAHGHVDLDQIRGALKRDTRLIALTHASNVTGVLQPVVEVSRLAKEQGCLFLVDAAQTLGHVPIDVASWQVDFLAAPGHKGLLGPLGTGLLYIAPGCEQQLPSLRQGGTGTQSERATQPEQLPAKYESGNLNVPGLVGLDAGVRFVLDQELDKSPEQWALRRELMEQLSEVPRVKLFGVVDPGEAVGIVSFTVEGYDPREVASMLDATGRVQMRAGLHCAPEMHRALGTLTSGGTVRASTGHFNSSEQIGQTVELIRACALSAVN